MEVVATHTFQTLPAACEQTTDLPMVLALSTVTCANTTRSSRWTAAPRTWRRRVTSVTCWATRKTCSTTSSAATPPSSRTTRTCSMPALQCPKELRSSTMEKRCSATQPTRFRRITRKESTGVAYKVWAASWSKKTWCRTALAATQPWIWWLPLTLKWRSPEIPLTCEHIRS